MSRYQEIVTNQNRPVILVDQNGLIQKISLAFQDAYGWTEAELKGKMLISIIPESMRNAHHMGFSRFLTSGKATILEHPLDLNIVCANGVEKQARHLISAKRVNGQWSFAAFIDDIS